MQCYWVIHIVWVMLLYCVSMQCNISVPIFSVQCNVSVQPNGVHCNITVQSSFVPQRGEEIVRLR